MARWFVKTTIGWMLLVLLVTSHGVDAIERVNAAKLLGRNRRAQVDEQVKTRARKDDLKDFVKYFDQVLKDAKTVPDYFYDVFDPRVAINYCGENEKLTDEEFAIIEPLLKTLTKLGGKSGARHDIAKLTLDSYTSGKQLTKSECVEIAKKAMTMIGEKTTTKTTTKTKEKGTGGFLEIQSQQKMRIFGFDAGVVGIGLGLIGIIGVGAYYLMGGEPEEEEVMALENDIDHYTLGYESELSGLRLVAVNGAGDGWTAPRSPMEYAVTGNAPGTRWPLLKVTGDLCTRRLDLANIDDIGVDLNMLDKAHCTLEIVTGPESQATANQQNVMNALHAFIEAVIHVEQNNGQDTNAWQHGGTDIADRDWLHGRGYERVVLLRDVINRYNTQYGNGHVGYALAWKQTMLDAHVDDTHYLLITTRAALTTTNAGRSLQVNIAVTLADYGRADNDNLHLAFPADTNNHNSNYDIMGRGLYDDLRQNVRGFLDGIPVLQPYRDNNQVRGFFIALGMYIWVDGRATSRATAQYRAGHYLKNTHGLLCKTGVNDLLRGIESAPARAAIYTWAVTNNGADASRTAAGNFFCVRNGLGGGGPANCRAALGREWDRIFNRVIGRYTGETGIAYGYGLTADPTDATQVTHAHSSIPLFFVNHHSALVLESRDDCTMTAGFKTCRRNGGWREYNGGCTLNAWVAPLTTSINVVRAINGLIAE